MRHADLIAILLRNLVDNAVRYSFEGSRVRVEVLGVAGGARVAIADQGPGIATGERAKLGQRFYRVLGTGRSGSGLGLSIAHRIAAIHSSALAFETPENGKGLRVTITFPRRMSE